MRFWFALGISLSMAVLTSYIYLFFTWGHEPSRQAQFIASCSALFEASGEECTVFMERWGRFMAR